MTRAVAIISCLIATLLLVHVHVECGEIAEYEPENEVECCAVVYSLSQSEILEKHPEVLKCFCIRTRLCRVSVKPQERVSGLPARILNCVFRE